MLEKPSYFPPTSNPALQVSRPDPAPATNLKGVVYSGAGVGAAVGGNGMGLWDEKQQTKKLSTTKPNRKLGRFDQKILELLETWGALGLGQLMGAFGAKGRRAGTMMELFFNKAFRSEGKVYKHVRKLQRRGLIRNYSSQHRFLYGLTRKGHAELVRLGLARLPDCTKEIGGPISVEHRLVCAAVGLAAERIWGAKARSERQVYNELIENSGGRMPAGFRLPDLLIEIGGEEIPVEIELHQKSNARYFRIWRYYREKLGGSGRVLYLVPIARRRGGLLKLAGKLGFGVVYACDLPAFRAAGGRPVFQNFRGQEYLPQ